jgi:hypothetical protein
MRFRTILIFLPFLFILVVGSPELVFSRSQKHGFENRRKPLGLAVFITLPRNKSENAIFNNDVVLVQEALLRRGWQSADFLKPKDSPKSRRNLDDFLEKVVFPVIQKQNTSFLFLYVSGHGHIEKPLKPGLILHEDEEKDEVRYLNWDSLLGKFSRFPNLSIFLLPDI